VTLNQQVNIYFSMERGMRIMNYVQVSFVHMRIISTVKRVEFDSDRMSYIILRDCWCDIISLYLSDNFSIQNGL
jgi:hypothetical protein